MFTESNLARYLPPASIPVATSGCVQLVIHGALEQHADPVWFTLRGVSAVPRRFALVLTTSLCCVSTST
jgi:hypothetical protein